MVIFVGFIPQKEISQNEVKHLSMISNNSIIRHRICLSDSLVLSCMKFVDKNQFFQRYEMSELLMSIDDDDIDDDRDMIVNPVIVTIYETLHTVMMKIGIVKNILMIH